MKTDPAVRFDGSETGCSVRLAKPQSREATKFGEIIASFDAK